MIYSLGRDADNDIRIMDPAVSRHHLRIHNDSFGYFLIEDLDSTGWTFINGERIKIGKLFPNDELKIAEIPTTYEWLQKQIAFYVQQNKTDFAEDFRALQQQYDDYQLAIKKLDWKKQLRVYGANIIIILSIAAVNIIFFSKNATADKLFQVLTSIVLIASYLLLQGRENKLDKEKENLRDEFLLYYRCPKCRADLKDRNYRSFVGTRCSDCRLEFT